MTKPATKAEQVAAGELLTISPERPSALKEGKAGGLTLHDALERWYTSLQASESVKSLRTIDAYRYATDKLVSSVGSQTPLEAVQPESLETLLASLKTAGASAATRQAVYRPIRTFLKWCVKRGHLSVSPAEEVDAPKVPAQPIEFVTDAEWSAILATTESKSRWAFRARRDRAVLLMLATTGARLSEVAGLQVGEVDLEARSLLVHGKGGKDRVLPLLPEAHEAVSTYLRLERPRSPYSSTSDALWLASRGVLTPNGLAQMVAERGEAAGITKRRVHPHELRHRAIAGWLRAGMPDTLVMALSGHSTHAMLARYGAATRQEDAMAYLRSLAASAASAP
jgi:site-specific recombinase XerD